MEQQIFIVASLFADEARKLNERKPGADLRIELSVTASGGKYGDFTTKAELHCQFWDGRTHQRCSAASLDALMSEVHHRLHFEDRQAIALDVVNAEMTGLPKPTPSGRDGEPISAHSDDEIPF